jgi:putative hydrolase of HD superfamily
MKDTLVDAIQSLFTIQRWNFLPRVETWVEAENVAYSAHIGFALLCNVAETSEFNKMAFDYLAYEILKPLTKHFLSDVSYRSKTGLEDLLKELEVEKWEKKVAKIANDKIPPLFPRMIRPQVKRYLVKSNEDKIIDLCKYVQRKTAFQECERNATVYNEYYRKHIIEIGDDIVELSKKNTWMKDINDTFEQYNKNEDTHDKDINTIPGYFGVIRNLKYLRRWNRINRSIETTVLAHTYVVTLLTLLFTWMHEDKFDTDLKRIEPIQRALFHDVPEALTGDIITPVKDIIKNEYPKIDNLWDKVENKLAKTPIKKLIGTSSKLAQYIDDYHLLDEVTDKEKDSAISLVKDCDRMALVIECIQEGLNAKIPREMSKVYHDYLEDLQNSEWSHIREFAAKLATRYPLASSAD